MDEVKNLYEAYIKVWVCENDFHDAYEYISDLVEKLESLDYCIDCKVVALAKSGGDDK